jgi:hypothetical protein
MTALICEGGKHGTPTMLTKSEGHEETIASHGVVGLHKAILNGSDVVRQSRSRQLSLAVLPQQIETRTVPNRQLDKVVAERIGLDKVHAAVSPDLSNLPESVRQAIGCKDVVDPAILKRFRMIKGSTEKVAWKSDKSLLDRRDPTRSSLGYHRVTSRSKRRDWIPEPEQVAQVYTVTIWYEEMRVPATIPNVEHVAEINPNTIEVSCFGEYPAIHRKVKRWEVKAENPSDKSLQGLGLED